MTISATQISKLNATIDDMETKVKEYNVFMDSLSDGERRNFVTMLGLPRAAEMVEKAPERSRKQADWKKWAKFALEVKGVLNG